MPPGYLFVANGGNNSITEYAPPYTGAPIATITNGISTLLGIAVDSHGNLFAGTVNSIVEYASPYTGAPTVISNGIANPEFVIDTAGNLFVLNQPSNEPCCGTFSLRKYAPPYTGSPVVTANFDGNMVGLALNAAGDVFVTSFEAYPLKELAPPYQLPAYNLDLSTRNAYPTLGDLAVSPAGNLLSRFPGITKCGKMSRPIQRLTPPLSRAG